MVKLISCFNENEIGFFYRNLKSSFSLVKAEIHFEHFFRKKKNVFLEEMRGYVQILFLMNLNVSCLFILFSSFM